MCKCNFSAYGYRNSCLARGSNLLNPKPICSTKSTEAWTGGHQRRLIATDSTDSWKFAQGLTENVHRHGAMLWQAQQRAQMSHNTSNSPTNQPDEFV